jgi:hypothetical protein
MPPLNPPKFEAVEKRFPLKLDDSNFTREAFFNSLLTLSAPQAFVFLRNSHRSRMMHAGQSGFLALHT